ncbi:ROK family transcriptional regulator [Niabella sp. 22666]|uniref:ROK family transcriptional regulator n=1 Tax=Niabella sp. 22666 TaxID=3453954 RepID=UPI003F852F78
MKGLKGFIAELQEKSQITSGVSFKNVQLQKDIVEYFIKNGRVTIAELSQHTKVSVPKINDLVNELLKNGLLVDLGKEIIGVGRKPNFYGLNPEAGYFLSIEIHRHHINIALVNFREEIVDVKENIPFELQNTKAKFDELCKITEAYLKNHKAYLEKLAGIGLTITGRVNHRTGNSYSFFNFHEQPLSEILSERFKLPCYIENDTRAMSFGEYAKGCVTNEKDILFLNLNDGIGMGIIIKGDLYSGKSGFAGEFGHLAILNNDIICHCGKKGCLETEASGAAIISQVVDAIQNGTSTILTETSRHEEISLHKVVDAALKDDSLCIEVISTAGEKIGKGIALMLNLFNPELVIIGGEMARAGSLTLLPILSSINKHSLNLVNTDTEFRFSKLGKRAGLIGVSLLLRNHLLDIH